MKIIDSLIKEQFQWSYRGIKDQHEFNGPRLGEKGHELNEANFLQSWSTIKMQVDKMQLL